MADLIQNADPKRNPITTIFGICLLLIGTMLFALPYFVTLKEPVAWWGPLLPLGAGILLLFINDDYFKQLFSFGLGWGKKKTGIE